MTEQDDRTKEALFRYGLLAPLITKALRRGELKRLLRDLAEQTWTDSYGYPRKVAAKTLEEWLYRYRRGGLDGLAPHPRTDLGVVRALAPELVALILDMKREDPGRSAPLIKRELELAGRLRVGQVHVATIRRVLARAGLSGPALELARPARHRWQAERANALWQADAVHGPALFDPASGRPIRVKIFGLIDDRSRLVPYLRAGFHETQAAFLVVLAGGVQRRGVPEGVFADQHQSFAGSDTDLACAQLGSRMILAQPYDGPAKGKIERFWRTLRAHVLDRLDPTQVTTLDDLNTRLSAWVESEYNRRPHASLDGRTPLEAWEADAEHVRWIDDPALLDKAFTATFTRRAKNDSTVQVQGRTYEVPTHLRGETVTLGHSLLHPERLWVDDRGTRVPLREVDAVGNATRARRKADSPAPSAKKTGLNAVEAVLRRMTRRPDAGKEGA